MELFAKILVCLRSVVIMLMTKIMLDTWMWGLFQNKYGAIVNWENVRTNMCQCTKSCRKTANFSLKTKLYWKETPEIFDSTRWFSLQSLIRSSICLFKVCFEIIRIWELLFRSVGSYFSFKLLYLQRKTAL